MATIHMILQSKGGVGKSMIAAILYQVLQHLGKDVHAFDTDPSNSTFFGYREFKVKRLEILSDRDKNIDPRAFDEMFEAICDLSPEAHVVIDNGASSFIALSSYLKENEAMNVFKENGHTVVFHTVITGGQAIVDTLSGLKSLAEHFPETPLAVWLNPYFGDIHIDGKNFEDFTVYREHNHQFSSIIALPSVTAATTGKDLEELYAKRQSFAVGMSSSRPIMVRSRLTRYWNTLVGLIQNSPFAA